jgi:hypothetical protein
MARILRLPILHQPQRQIRAEAGRFNVPCCGRRFGKDIEILDLVAETILDKYPVGWWEPTYPSLSDGWRRAKALLQPITRRVSESNHRIECSGGGVLDMWTLERPDSGRGRKYKRVIVNEAAMARFLQEAWEETIRPTLTDYRGDAWFWSTPKGRNFYWQLWKRGQDPLRHEQGWRSWRFPTVSNPHIDPAEVLAAKAELPERVFMQEYEAEFLENSAGVFRGVYDAVDDGRSANEEPKEWETYVAGLDLARVNDFTVITIFDSSGRQVYHERFNQLSWERQINAVVDVSERYHVAMWWIDSTGIGDPLIEALWRKGIPAQGYKLTNMSKMMLIDSYAMAIERKMVRLMDIAVQTDELIAFEYEQTEAGNTRMNAPRGGHDDTVISGALGNHGLRKMGYTQQNKPQPGPPMMSPAGIAARAMGVRKTPW